MPKRGHRRSRRADSRGHDERGTCTPRAIKPTPASRITLRGASHTRRLTLPPCSCPPEPSGTCAPAEMTSSCTPASPRSRPPSTSNHGPTAHESRRGGVAWLGQAVRWSGSGAGPTGCHQASGGGCSGLPQPVMNSTSGRPQLAIDLLQLLLRRSTFLFGLSTPTVNLPLVYEWILPGIFFDLLLSSAVRSRILGILLHAGWLSASGKIGPKAID